MANKDSFPVSVQESAKKNLGAIALSPDILYKAQIGLWAFELDKGHPARMYVDEAMLELLGLTEQISPEETYHAWYDNIDKDSYGLVADAVEKMTSGEHAEVQYPWHHPNGSVMIVRCGGVRNPAYTKGIRIEGTHQNVTEVLHFDESERRKQRELLGLQLVSTLSGNFSSLFYVNAETGEYQTITKNDEYGSKVDINVVHEGNFYKDTYASLKKVVYRDDIAKLEPLCSKEKMEAAFGKNDLFGIEYRLVIEGIPVWYSVKVARVPSENQEMHYAIGVMCIQDEINKLEASERDAAVIAGLSDDFGSVIYLDIKTGEEVNYRFDQFFSSKLKDWDKITNFDERMKLLSDKLVVEEDKKYMMPSAEGRKNVLDAIRKEGVYYRNFRIFADGEIKYFQLKFVMDEKTGTHLIVGIRNIDETTKKEIEYQEKLEAANKSKTDFLFNMSHDIRTPMNAIIGFTRMAKKYTNDSEKVADCLGKIEYSGNLLLELINEVLDLSRIEAGKLRSEIAPVSVSDSTKRLVTIFRETAKEHNIGFSYCEKDLVHPNVFADELHLKQILINIFGNAVKYTKDSGKIGLTLLEEKTDIPGYGRYSCIVEDTGVGMSQEFLNHVFDSFAREDKASTSEIQGTGLGMAIVKKLVDFLDGTINIESEQGKGTKVTVSFCLRQDTGETLPAENSGKNEETCANLSGRHVLLVEDIELNREIAKDILGEVGLIVDLAVDGFDAIDILTKRGLSYYDFILMDIQMPRMDGYETTAKIRKMEGSAKIPIIALSANAFEEDRTKSLEAGMNDHVSKPIVVETLIKVISKYLK